VRAAALVTAIAAAVILPSGPPGIGVLIIGVLVIATVLIRARPTRDVVLFGSLALALVSMASVLDAGWIVALDLTAAVLLASAAVAGARATAPVAVLLALRRLPALAPRPAPRFAPAARGVLGGGLLVIPFGALFWTADAAFASVGRSAPLPNLGSLPGQLLAFTLVLVGTIGLALARDVTVGVPRPAVRRLSFLEWFVPIAAVDLLFVGFVAVQANVLFAGHGYVERTTGLTYAEYARHGFWQLLATAVLALGVVGTASVVSDARSRGERLARRVLLGLLTLLTLVVIASALHRLRLYEAAFGLSRLRLLAEAFALWLAALFALLLVAGTAAPVQRRLGRIVTVGTALGLLAFSVANPDGMIARRNIDRWHETGRLDVAYLSSLSADAVPAIASLPEPFRKRALAPIKSRLGPHDVWSSMNLGRRRARSTL
jgi:hypothetical protein